MSQPNHNTIKSLIMSSRGSRKSPSRKSPSKKSPSKKTASKKSPSKKSPSKKTAAKKSPPRLASRLAAPGSIANPTPAQMAVAVEASKPKSPKRKSASPKRTHHRPTKDCVREWVTSPVSGRAIEVNGKTWTDLYPTHKAELDAAERKTTPGVMKGDTCVPPLGDPPHGWGGRGRSHSRSHSRSPGRGYGLGHGSPHWDPSWGAWGRSWPRGWDRRYHPGHYRRHRRGGSWFYDPIISLGTPGFGVSLRL